MKHFPLIAIIVVVVAATLSTADILPDPDESRDFFQLVEARGYSLQSYEVTTKDDYILTIHRVVTTDYQKGTYEKERRPVILNHGLFSSGNNFFITSDIVRTSDGKCSDDFGFCLVNTQKYDVWVSQNRGNGYSNGHKTLTTKDHEYWNFSIDELSKYDLPATIDFVRNFTKHHTVGYVGHSQGNAIMFGLLSERPEYADIIKPYIAWSPAVFVGHMTSILKDLLPLKNPVEKIAGEFKLLDKIPNVIGEAACRVGLFEPICAKILESVGGPSDHIDKHRIQTLFHFWPSPSSSWQIVQYGQWYETKKFQKFDYLSAEKNLEKYGQEKPPEYNLKRIYPNATIAIFYSKADSLVVEEDVMQLVDIIRPVVKNLELYEVEDQKFNHLDYVVGKGAGKLVYDRTVPILDKYTQD